jgi:hypothetical protein
LGRRFSNGARRKLAKIFAASALHRRVCMQRLFFVGLACACGSSSGSVFHTNGDDAAYPPPVVIDAAPGPDDIIDASLPTGIACTPGEVRVITALDASTFEFSNLVVDDTSIYWRGFDPDAAMDATQGYWWAQTAAFRADKSGSAPARLFPTSSLGRSLLDGTFTVDATNAYWVEPSDSGFGSILRGAKDGSTSTPLVSGIAAPSRLEVASGMLYFVSGSWLMRIGVDGTNEASIAQTASPFTEYVVGDEAIYAIESGQPVRVSRSGGAFESMIIAPNAPNARYEGLSLGNDGFVYMTQIAGEGYYVASASIVRIATDRGTPLAVTAPFDLQSVETTQIHFTARDGDCTYYSTGQGLFSTCRGAIGSGPVIAAPAIDSTSVYWATTSAIYAWCKM